MDHASIINFWPAMSVFADDIGVPYVTAKAMRRRGSIPPGYWVRVVEAAGRRGIDGVSYQRLAELSALPEPQKEAAE